MKIITETEEWRDIPGYEGLYQASDLGRIKSLARVVDRRSHHGRTIPHSVPERMLSQTPDGQRLFVTLSREDNKSNRKVHRLVLETFVGPKPANMEGCHGDGNGFNNRLENLRWDTHVNNEKDKILHGTIPRGENHNFAKLTEAQVLEIRSLAGSIYQKDIAKQFGVGKAAIGKIISRQRWAHLPPLTEEHY